MKCNPADGFPYYFELTKGEDIYTLFSSTSVFEFLESISDEMSCYRYESDKWSIKEIVGHITDHERIKMFRAFQLSRGQVVQLWGYDQNLLVAKSRFSELTMRQLIEDLVNVRRASLSFVKTLSKSQLEIVGNARQYEITLEDFLKSIIGHEIHHINVIKTRYIV